MKTVRFREKEVPSLIFGTLTMAPIQRNVPVSEGGDVIGAALSKGIRWLDTAQMYGSYPHVRDGLKKAGVPRDELVISSKSVAASEDDMNRAVNEALQAMDCASIDLFLLHAVRSMDDFAQKQGALRALLTAVRDGRIQAIGVSTHSTVCAAALADDDRFEWYHLVFNQTGTGLTDGTLAEQQAVIEKVKNRGAHVYAMKPLGGGYLKGDAIAALDWVRKQPFIDAVALGMASVAEVEMNLRVFNGESVPDALRDRLRAIDKSLFVFKPLCTGCGACEESCEQSAIAVEGAKAAVSKEKCILCGYCVPVCPQFALRIV